MIAEATAGVIQMHSIVHTIQQAWTPLTVRRKKPLHGLDLIKIPFKAFNMDFESDATSSLQINYFTVSLCGCIR